MKRLGWLLWTLIPTTCLAGDGMLGTKLGGAAPMATSSTSPVSGQAVVQLIVALGVVLLIVRYILPKALNKVNRRLNTSATGGIRVEESASFAGGNLYIVNARGKSLLLSVTGTAVTCLADITSAEQPANEPKTFQEMLDEAPGEVPTPQAQPLNAADPFAETLARLDRLDRLTNS